MPPPTRGGRRVAQRHTWLERSHLICKTELRSPTQDAPSAEADVPAAPQPTVSSKPLSVQHRLEPLLHDLLPFLESVALKR